MKRLNDPIGQAILDFSSTKKSQDITVSSDLCEDDVIPSSYLFRAYEQMPKLEQLALKQCRGKTLDIGAGAGPHSLYLKKQGLQVKAIETSEGACRYLRENNVDVVQNSILNYSEEKFDTLLLLMNGIGLAGNSEKLEPFLIHLKSLLAENGQIICDSTDIQYLYQDDEGAIWIDLNASYYGNFKFQMNYQNHQTDWFEWLYVDFQKLQDTANRVGLNATLMYEEEGHFLALLKQL